MKIAGTGSLRSNAPRRRGGTDAAAGDFAGHMNGPEKAQTPAVSGTTQIASVGALVALQASGGFGSDSAAAEIDRAGDLLDQLDRIRVGILTGGISGATLQNIVQRLAQRRTEGVEPRLAALIDEIELRARVEIAKLSMN
ncbi:MAG: flagellar assembly protein FliX [Alphaproteobacteria bacterium]